MRGGASTRDKADLATQPRRSVRRAEAVEHVPLAVDALMLAVWSPHGSQGRSTIAAALAHTFAKGLKLPGHVLLVDADTYAPAQHVLHGATEITAGILAGLLGLLLVVVYLVIYYRALGLVAVASLLVAGGSVTSGRIE